MSVDPLLVVLVGPTASGKTALSLALAERFMGEIVNCDSVAVYREFEIGTAKPTADERARVPHHLFDILAPTEQMTAGEYSRRARQALADLKSRARLPIVVGGTGLYLRALIDGLAEGPERSDELRDRLRTSHQRHGEPWLNRVLQRLDPAAAARIHAHDIPKLIRAIEVCLVARRPLTDIELRLVASATAIDVAWMATLQDAAPDGEQPLLGEGKQAHLGGAEIVPARVLAEGHLDALVERRQRLQRE